MRIQDLNWMQVESLIQTEDRCIVPLGCCEQHSTLSLATDSILAERISVESADPVGVPVFPVVAFGVTPSFMAYPGTVSVKFSTYCALLIEILESLRNHGFRRILIVNGHGGNTPARAAVQEWVSGAHGIRVQWHDWWNAPKTMAAVAGIDPIASHASWMENFRWTRLEGVQSPAGSKKSIDLNLLRQMNAKEVREYLGDGNFAGAYERDDREMDEIWKVAVEETRSLLTDGWVELKPS